ncbi:MAG TPA: response regulator [Candidatus Sumerlaeota bacterium]|nr:response regulator [Candidatus Sumerlaeota bacterium]
MTAQPRPIALLMADDDEEDRLLAQDALHEARLSNNMYFVENGEDLMDFLYHRGRYSDAKAFPRPGLILLDLNMPRKDGREALREIKADPDLRRIPVVILTTSKAEEDIVRSYDLGVSGYITKPVSFEGLVSIMKALTRYWFEIVELPEE